MKQKDKVIIEKPKLTRADFNSQSLQLNCYHIKDISLNYHSLCVHYDFLTNLQLLLKLSILHITKY